MAALHKLVLARFQLTPFANQTLGATLALCVGVGFALSTQVRCICFLTIPALCGKTGRAYVSTFVITFVITGECWLTFKNHGTVLFDYFQHYFHSFMTMLLSSFLTQPPKCYVRCGKKSYSHKIRVAKENGEARVRKETFQQYAAIQQNFF